MKVHELKTWPDQFHAIFNGERKTCEFRRDDRGFEEGDCLHLREYDPEKKTYTEMSIVVRVTHIVRGPDFGIPEGFVVMSIRVMSAYP
jgi:hypothetical protein